MESSEGPSGGLCHVSNSFLSFQVNSIKILAALDPYDVSMCILFESPDLKVFQSYAPFSPRNCYTCVSIYGDWGILTIHRYSLSFYTLGL